MTEREGDLMEDKRLQKLTLTGLFAALIFTATFLLRIPNPLTGGYTHLGDCLIFLGVLILGRKYGAAAAGIGGALSDLLAGSAVYVLPTLLIKAGMAWIMGTVVGTETLSAKRQLAGSLLGGAFQVAGYCLTATIMVGLKPALLTVPSNLAQTGIGIAIFFLVAGALSRSRAGKVLFRGAEQRS